MMIETVCFGQNPKIFIDNIEEMKG